MAENYRRGERKALLKRVARRHLPSDHVTARKKGFSTPIGHWFDADWRAWSGALLDDGMLLASGTVRPDWQQQLERAGVGAPVGSRAAWLLVTAELWARRWLGGPVPTFPGDVS